MTAKVTSPTLPPSVQEAARAAEAAVKQLEALSPDVEQAAALRSAQAAVEAFWSAAAESVCPSHSLTPVSASALADFEAFLSSSPVIAEIPRRLLELHAQARAGGHHELATVIRSVRGRWLVRQAAGAIGRSLGAPEDAAYRRELRAFVDNLVMQMRDEHPAAADVLHRDVPALENRLAAIIARQAEYAQQAAERQAEAKRQAEAADLERDRLELRETEEFFDAIERRAREFNLNIGKSGLGTALVVGATLAGACRTGKPEHLIAAAVKLRREHLHLPGATWREARAREQHEAGHAAVVAFLRSLPGTKMIDFGERGQTVREGAYLGTVAQLANDLERLGPGPGAALAARVRQFFAPELSQAS